MQNIRVNEEVYAHDVKGIKHHGIVQEIISCAKIKLILLETLFLVEIDIDRLSKI